MRTFYVVKIVERASSRVLYVKIVNVPSGTKMCKPRNPQTTIPEKFASLLFNRNCINYQFFIAKSERALAFYPKGILALMKICLYTIKFLAQTVFLEYLQPRQHLHKFLVWAAEYVIVILVVC